MKVVVWRKTIYQLAVIFWSVRKPMSGDVLLQNKQTKKKMRRKKYKQTTFSFYFILFLRKKVKRSLHILKHRKHYKTPRFASQTVRHIIKQNRNNYNWDNKNINGILSLT